MGISKPLDTDANASPGRCSCKNHLRDWGTAHGENENIVRTPRLLWKSTETLYERLGPEVYHGQSRWFRSTVPNPLGNPKPQIRYGSRKFDSVDLARI